MCCRMILGVLALALCLSTPAFSANVFYNVAKKELLETLLVDSSADIRVVPVMSNTTVDTENDAKTTVNDFTTLDEFDGSGYSTGGIALSSEAAAVDDTNDRGEFDAADVSGLSYGNGTRQIVGFLIIKWNTNLTGSLPIAFIDRTSSPIDGSDLSGITWNAEGILQL